MESIKDRIQSGLKIGRSPIDLPLLYTILILLSLGLCIMFSGSSVTAARMHGDTLYFVKKQALWASISLIAFIVVANIDYRIYRKYATFLIFVSIILLVLVFIPGVGKSVGTHYGRNFNRWISIGNSFQIQPSELAKIAVVIYLSSFLCKIHQITYRSYHIYLVPGSLIFFVIALIIIEPAFGTTIEITFMLLALIYVNGFPLKKLFFGFLSSIPLLFILVYRVGYRKERIEVWLNPYKYRFDKGHQLVSSFKAFDSGGWFGNPIATGYSHRHLTYSHTDFIMATFVEDFGFIGFLVLFFLFLFLIIRSFILVKRVNDLFGFLLGIGIISMIGVQILINLFVVTGVFPITGISLPFVSYGGSSLLTVMLSLGILINITRRENLN
jgi:cell division protein FtsW